MNNPMASVLEGLTALGVIDSPDTFQTPVQLDSDLITLTLLPRARWQTLLNLDVITVGYLTYSVTMQLQ
jgi:UTP21-specific protein